jgi:hypothetical protein
VRPLDAPCIEWQGNRDTGGYGRDRRRERLQRFGTGLAHRQAWMEAHGPIGPDDVVMHKCDNPPCVNIDHLQVGTVADNNADKWAKGRGRTGHVPSGPDHWNARFTADQVAEIRSEMAKGRTGGSLARQFGVCHQLIYDIRNGKRYPEAHHG